MKGSYTLQISQARVQFKFTLTRNIAVIRGKSATGKTKLINMIAEYEEQGTSSGITLSSPKPCHTLSGRRWADELQEIHDSFVFIDEGEGFTTSYDFKYAIDGTDNYYVIASRDPLYSLPYSVEEVYALKNVTSRYPGVRKYYTQTKRMYANLPSVQNPELVIVEDSKAGFEFIHELCKRAGIECVSAKGKSNIVNMLEDCGEKRTLVIADGAAFGPEMEMVYALAKRKGVGLFLPESFEWLILSSGVIKDSDIDDVISNPSVYIESREYLSWERFFNSLLIAKTKDSYLHYNKSNLNAAYLQEREFAAVSKTFRPTGIL